MRRKAKRLNRKEKEQVKAALREGNKTQASLAQEYGVTSRTIRRYADIVDEEDAQSKKTVADAIETSTKETTPPPLPPDTPTPNDSESEPTIAEPEGEPTTEANVNDLLGAGQEADIFLCGNCHENGRRTTVEQGMSACPVCGATLEW
jgi:rubrerythrin